MTTEDDFPTPATPAQMLATPQAYNPAFLSWLRTLPPDEPVPEDTMTPFNEWLAQKRRDYNRETGLPEGSTLNPEGRALFLAWLDRTS